MEQPDVLAKRVLKLSVVDATAPKHTLQIMVSQIQENPRQFYFHAVEPRIRLCIHRYVCVSVCMS